MKRAVLLLAVPLLALLPLSGCGQMGPLYFDEDPPADQLPPSRKNPPATLAPVAVPVTAPAVAPAPVAAPAAAAAENPDTKR